MKKTRKIAAMIAAMALTATMAVPSVMMTASAAATAGQISFTGETAGTHNYTAYRILNGTAAANGMNDQTGAILTDASWAGTDGTNTMATFIAALQGMDALKVSDTNPFAALTPADATVNDLITGLSQFGANSAQAKAFAKYVVDNATTYGFPASSAGTTISETTDGYYVIKESSFTASATEGGAQTAYLLGVYDASAGAEVTVKADTPTVIKKIEENTKAVNSASAADNALNTNVSGKFNDVADYCFGDSIPFEIFGSMPDDIADYTTYYYEFTDSWTANQFAIVDGTNSATADTIDAGDFVVTIDNTVIPAAQYTVTPSAGNTGFTLTFNDIKAVTDGTDSVTITADSIVKVTYNLKFGSAAVIGLDGNENTVKLTYSNNPNHTGSGGTGNDTTSDTPVDTVIAFTYQLDVTKYKDSVADANKVGANEAGFKLQRSSDDKYAVVDANNKITGWVTAVNDATEVKTTAGGTFSFIGLDYGNYVLTETTTPTGYNTMSPLTITVDATTQNVQVYKENTDYDTPAEVLTALANGVLSTGAVAQNVINQQGSTLPSTGGMGTTLFILGGGVTAAAAGIYLVSKKRAKEEDAQ